MNNKELLECDIKDLATAYNCIHTAMSFLKDVEDFADDKYEMLNIIAEDINDLKIQKEIEFEREAEL